MKRIYNNIRYLGYCLMVVVLAASCHDGDWDTPTMNESREAWGNQYLQETNVITIAELKNQFKSYISNDKLQQVTKPTQIKAIVVGNDEGGNIYNGIYLQDLTGAIKVSISQSGLYGPFTVGQTVLVELEGLYVGGYGKEAQIGTTYTNPTKENATPQVGRMSRYLWQQHYKLIADIPGLYVSPKVLQGTFSGMDMDKDCGKLITLKGVVLTNANGTTKFAAAADAPSNQTAVSQPITGLKNVVLRTSTYADFANDAMPTGKVDITGIASRYRDDWQIYMRTAVDIKAAE